MKKNIKGFNYKFFKNTVLLSSLGICAACNNNTVNKHNQDNVKGDSSEDGDEENTPTFFKEEDKKDTGRINHAGKSRAEVGIEPGKKKSPIEERKSEDDLDVVELEKFKDFHSERGRQLNKNDSDEYDDLHLRNLCLDISNTNNLYYYNNLVFETKLLCREAYFICLDVEKDFKGSIKIPVEVCIKNQSSICPVTYICSGSFYNCQNIKSIVLPEKLIFINDYAFYGCKNLESIELPEKVVQIGSYAFADTGIKNIFIPKSVGILGKNAFCSDTIENIYLDEGSSLKESDILNALGNRWNGEKFSNEFINGKTYKVLRLIPIETRASDYNNNTVNKNNQDNIKTSTPSENSDTQETSKEIEIDKKNKKSLVEKEKCIEEDVLHSKELNKSYNSQGYRGEFVYTILKNYNELDITKEICSRIQRKEEDNFANVELNKFKKFYSGRAKLFIDCGLLKINILDDLYVFQNLVFEITQNNEVKLVFFDVERNFQGHIKVPKKVCIKGVYYSVTSIWERAFMGCENLGTVNIPSSIVLIDENSFRDCRKLKLDKLPKKLRRIGKRAFYCCANLKFEKLPNELTKIGVEAFQGTNIEKITIPKNVKKLGYGAFDKEVIKEIFLEKGSSLSKEILAGVFGKMFFDNVSENENYYVFFLSENNDKKNTGKKVGVKKENISDKKKEKYKEDSVLYKVNLKKNKKIHSGTVTMIRDSNLAEIQYISNPYFYENFDFFTFEHI